jgi:poly(3-hydroxybutyrate) depolymerase
MRKTVVTLCLALAVAGWPAPAAAAKILFKFRDWVGPPVRVFATRPVGLAADRPVVFVMHGTNRNADEYRDQWHDLAVEYDFLLLVPEFSKRDFPGPEGYNYGNVQDTDGSSRPPAEWAFSAIEKIFDEARRRFSIKTNAYAMYGHSAGAQFVHRFLYYVPDARLARVVVANAGWYTMPDPAVDFPYGLRGSAIGEAQVAAALGLPVTILLGENDTDPAHPSLRRTPEALAQGANRFERGQAFFRAAAQYAETLGVPFRWQLATVPGADHNNRLMAPAAVPYLLETD